MPTTRKPRFSGITLKGVNVPCGLMIMTVLFYRHFRFRLARNFKVEPDPLITLRPRHGLEMTLELRGEPNLADRRAAARSESRAR